MAPLLTISVAFFTRKNSCHVTFSHLYTWGYSEKILHFERGMDKAIWKEKLLEAVAGLGEEGCAASEFLRRRKTFIGFWQVRKNVGAFWTFLGTIHFNSFYYSLNSDVNDVSLLT